MTTIPHQGSIDPADFNSVWRLPFSPATLAVAIAAFLGGLLALGPAAAQ